MQFFKWLLAGAIGGAIGAAIWVLVGHFSGYEVGWIAWGIGLLCGLGVRKAAGDVEGAAPGLAAVSAAATSVLLAKYVVVVLAVNQAIDQIEQMQVAQAADPNAPIVWIADEIVWERQEAGKPVQWPAGSSFETAVAEADYPPDVWAEATSRWTSMSPDEKDAMKAGAVVPIDRATVRQEVFSSSFGGWDLLWFGLAAFTAFKLGSGTSDE